MLGAQWKAGWRAERPGCGTTGSSSSCTFLCVQRLWVRVTTTPCLSPALDMGKSSHVSPAEPKPTGASPHTAPWALPVALPTSPLPALGRPELLVTAKSHGQRDPQLQRARSCDRRAVSGRPCARQCSEVRAGRQRRAPSCAAQKSPWNQHVY